MKKNAPTRLTRRGMIKSSSSIAGLAALGQACSRSPNYQVNYRLRIKVVVSGMPFSGSAVENVRWFSGGFLTGFDAIGAFNSVAHAESVVLDLGQDGLLFGLVFPPQNRPGFQARYIESAFTPEMPPDLLTQDAIRSGAFLHHLTHMTGEYPIPKDDWPTFVRFNNIAKAQSAQIVYPSDLARVYGPGSSFESASVEITNEPITKRINQVLPWLAHSKGPFIWEKKPTPNSPDAARLSRECFILDGS